MPIATLISAVKSWTLKQIKAAEGRMFSGRYEDLTGKPEPIGRQGRGSGSVEFNEGTANGDLSHAVGMGVAVGYCSHAEGNLAEAHGFYSHAEGCSTYTSGDCAHAEGYGTAALGEAAHAEGASARAESDYSHAEGNGTKALSTCQHAQGRYNAEDAGGTYAHIVGNGTSGNNRSNAHTLDWDGNGWYAGTLYVGGTSQADGAEVATKAYVDEMLGVIENGSY